MAVSTVLKSLDDIEWVGGHLALDFVNTVSAWYGDEPGDDYLADFAALVHRHEKADVIGPKSAKIFLGGTSRAQNAAHREALELRRALRQVFMAVTQAKPLPQAALDRINQVVHDTVQWRKLTAESNRCRCVWSFADAEPKALLGIVAWRAFEFIETGPFERLKACPGEHCGWMFVDTSKNRSRQWCSMKACGNAVKVKRFRERQAG